MFVALAALTGFIFILVFANSLTMLVIGQVLCGFPWGVFVSHHFISEIPLANRYRSKL